MLGRASLCCRGCGPLRRGPAELPYEACASTRPFTDLDLGRLFRAVGARHATGRWRGSFDVRHGPASGAGPQPRRPRPRHSRRACKLKRFADGVLPRVSPAQFGHGAARRPKVFGVIHLLPSSFKAVSRLCSAKLESARVLKLPRSRSEARDARAGFAISGLEVVSPPRPHRGVRGAVLRSSPGLPLVVEPRSMPGFDLADPRGTWTIPVFEGMGAAGRRANRTSNGYRPADSGRWRSGGTNCRARHLAVSYEDAGRGPRKDSKGRWFGVAMRRVNKAAARKTQEAHRCPEVSGHGGDCRAVGSNLGGTDRRTMGTPSKLLVPCCRSSL